MNFQSVFTNIFCAMCPRSGLTRRSASLLIAAVQFMHGLGTFLSASVSLKHASRTAYLSLVSASAMNMWLALVLLVGINMNRPVLILLWLGWAALIVVLFVIAVPFMAIYSYAISEQLKGSNFALTYITFALSFFLHCFFVHVVYGYYEEMSLARMEKERELFRLQLGHQNNLQRQDIPYSSPPELHYKSAPAIYTIKTSDTSTHEIKNEKKSEIN